MMSFPLMLVLASGLLALVAAWLLRRYEAVVRIKTDVPVSLRGTLPLHAAKHVSIQATQSETAQA